MLRIGVMVSGGGTNLQAIMDKIDDGTLKDCSVVTVVSSNSKAYAIQRAKKGRFLLKSSHEKVLKMVLIMIVH